MPNNLCRMFSAILTCLIACAFSLFSYASNLDTSSIQHSYNLKDVVDIQYTNQGLLLSDVLETSDWDQEFSVAALPADKVMWLRFSLNHGIQNVYQNTDLMNKDLTLLAGNAFVDRIDGFLLDEQGRIIQSIQRNNLDNIVAADTQNAFKMQFSIRPEQSLSIYLRVSDDGPATFPLEIWETDAARQQESTRLILLGALSGGLSLLATYFFITYLVRSTPSRFWFAVFSIAAMTTLLSAEGILPHLFSLPAYAAEITTFALMITIFSAIKIGRIIFSPISKNWLRGHYALLAAPFVSLFLSNDLWQLIVLLTIIGVFLVSKLTATIIYRKQVDVRSTALYFSGWCVLGVVSALEIIGFLASTSHLADSSALPFVFTCIGVMLIGVAIVSREQSIQAKSENENHNTITVLSEYQSFFLNSSDGLYTSQANGDLIDVNPQLSYLFGFIDSKHMLSIYPHISDLFTDTKEADLIFGELQIQQEVVGRECKGKRLDGSEFWFSISCNITKREQGNVQYGTIFDVTERRLHQINQQYLNTHDQLTGLYNRRHFLNILDETISTQDDKKSYALLYIDVDQFKIINDTCGHNAGDVYIKQLSHELFDIIHQFECFARLSADEFGLLMSYQKEDQLEAVAHRISAKVRAFEFIWDKRSFTQSVSIGICKHERDIMSASELLSYADTACVVAKDNGRDKVHIYSREMGINVTYERELYWINQVNSALQQDSFILFYQHYRPLMPADDHDHFEILLRLKDEEGRLIMPEHFMPAAERYNLSNKIDRWVIENTFDWLNVNNELQSGIAKCNINLSGASLSDEEFKYFLLNAFEKYGIAHEMICFEITETMAIVKMTDALVFIEEFKRLGCTFALDDFGTGFSSYSYLKNLPIDFVKIDGNFIRDILHDPIDLAMVTSIKEVAEAMSIKTVAEFVENKETLVQLGKMGVDYAQGYCVAEPDRLDNFTPYSQWIQ